MIFVNPVRVFVFLLSGLFCCLGFSGVIVFAVWAGACFFLLFGRGPRPRLNSKKKNTPPPKQQKKKKKNTHPPLPSMFLFFAVWAGGCVYFLLFGRGACFLFAVWAGGVFFFLLFGRGRVLFLLFGRGRVLFFAVWAGGVFFFLLFGRGPGVHSLTRLPGSSLSDPTTKETEQQKKNTVSL